MSIRIPVGCNSTTLLLSISSACGRRSSKASRTGLINVAVWESVAHFKQAFMHPSFQAHLKDYPPSTVASPHLFAKVSGPQYLCRRMNALPPSALQRTGNGGLL